MCCVSSFADSQDIVRDVREYSYGQSHPLSFLDKFGQFLSYPSCCIDFVKLNQKVPKLIEALKYLVIKNKYNVWCWPVASISDSSLLTHFPCSFNCVESQQLSKTRFKLLTKYGSEFLINKIVKYHTLNYYIENQKIKFTSDNNVSFISPNESINEL